MPDLTPCNCINGVPPMERVTDIYAAVREWAGDESLPTAVCVNGMPLNDKLDEIYCALYGIATT